MNDRHKKMKMNKTNAGAGRPVTVEVQLGAASRHDGIGGGMRAHFGRIMNFLPMGAVLRAVFIGILLFGATLSLGVADAQALQVKKGTFQTGTATGNVVVTGVGFQPKAVIFYHTRQATLDANATGQLMGYGFAAGSPIVNRGTAIGSIDALTTTNAGYRRSETYSLVALSNGTPTLSGQASVTAFGVDGFTVNWQSAPGVNAYVHYIALGGDDLQAAAGTFNLATTGAAQSVTGLSFQPNFALFLSSLTAAVDGVAGTSSYLNVGFTDGTAQGSTSVSVRDANATANNRAQQRTDNVLTGLTNLAAQDFLASFTSFNANGFTLNVTDLPAASTPIFYLALRGPGFKVGSLTRRTTVGTDVVNTLGFKPALVYLQSFNRAAATTIAANAEISIGASDGTAEGAAWSEYVDAATDDANMFTTAQKVIISRTANATSDAAADLQSLDPSGFTLNWTTANATAMQYLYWAANPCTFNAPTVTLTPAAGVITTAAGNSAYTISVTNNDTGVCQDVSYALTANNAGGTNPAGFSTAVTGSPLVLAQGASGTATLTVTRTSAASGQTIINTATAAATSHANGVSGSATTTYTTNPYTLIGNGAPAAPSGVLDPGTAANLDAFDLSVGNGVGDGTSNDAITAVTVTLSANSDQVDHLEIWNNPPTFKVADMSFGSGQNWAANGLNLTAPDSGVARYMVKIVAKVTVPAGSYPVSGRVTAVTSQDGNLIVNNEATAEATITIQAGTNNSTTSAMTFSKVKYDSITVAVAYSGDNNRNNVCTLAWGTDGSTYPNTLTSTNDRDANSCSATATGLAMDTLHYFRASFTDIDGIAGSPVTGSQRTTLLSMLHSSSVTGNKYPTWGTNYSCATCHGKNTSPNVKRIATAVGGAGLTNAVGTVVTGNALSATIASGATANFSDNATTNKVCDSCHGSTSIYKRGVSNATSGTPLMITGASPPHPADPDCVKCHLHNAGFKVKDGCIDCHNVGGTYQVATAAFTIVNTTGVALRTEAYGGHLKLTVGENLAGVTDWNARCLSCHDGHVNTNGVHIPENPAVGIDYLRGYIALGGTATSGTTEAEICWNCHDAVGVSEWGTNTDTNGALNNYNFGTLYTSAAKTTTTSRWIASYWTSANFSYKEGWLNNKPNTTDPVNGTANAGSTHAAAIGTGTAKGVDAVASIRCSYCHDVHNTAAMTVSWNATAKTNDVNGKPYLRGRWVGSPYKEDGAPRQGQAGTYPVPNTTTNPWGAVPRGSAAVGTVLGGFQIDQNNGNPIALTYTATQFGGLCDLCHSATKDGAFTAAEIDALNQYDAAGAGWVSVLNGHSNSVQGGTDSTLAARNIFAGRGGANTQTTLNTADHPYMGFQGTSLPGDASGGFRGTRAQWAYTPAMVTDPMDGGGWVNTGWNNLAGRTLDWTGTTIDATFHSFSCSKCHTPHASRLPALMISNCLDTKINTWDNAFQVHGTTDAVNAGRAISNWSSAQNCHRLGGDDPADTRDTAANTATAGNKGWNTVTPW